MRKLKAKKKKKEGSSTWGRRASEWRVTYSVQMRDHGYHEGGMGIASDRSGPVAVSSANQLCKS